MTPPLLLPILWLALRAPVPIDVDAAAALARLEYCSLLTGCALRPPPGMCSAESNRGVPGVSYDAARCGPARDLAAHGLATDDLASFGPYRFLGKRYQVQYAVSGRLPISSERLAFLLAELPLAAKLLTCFRGTRYTAEFLDADRRRFRGSREGTLDGEATLLAGGAGSLVYFGYGRSEIGVWRLGGASLARLDFAPVPPPARGLTYSLTVTVTPDTALLDHLMDLRLFRWLVERRIREVVTDIDAAARQLAEEGLVGARRKATFTPADSARIAWFLTLP